MKTFGFTTALSYLMQGKKVRRAAWPCGAWVKVVNGYIEDEEGDDFCAVTESRSFLADDWEMVDE